LVNCGIADTRIDGFGLRLWAADSGSRKAYAIRISDLNGSSIRKTFDIRNSWRTGFGAHSGHPPDLGDYLDDAREWARDEIDTLKGQLTLRDENWIRHSGAGSYVRRITLGDAAHSLLSGMRANGRAERVRAFKEHAA
jgi:hypothetical protein